MDFPVPNVAPGEATPRVDFLPLGGLGQIGMNCFALEQDGQLLVVDCGATFPEDDIGEDLIVPDFSYLIERESQIAGIFITHGHEDHIGALPHLLRQFSGVVPLYAPAHAAALIALRLEENEIRDAELRVVSVQTRYDVGPFVVEPIAVSHSIVQATSLCIETKVGRIIHTADFDLDEQQPAGWVTDVERFRTLGDEGVTLLLSDSTNIYAPTRERDEGDVGRELVSQVLSARKRVIVGLFSSNAHRLASLIDAAVQSNRRLCLLGRSLQRHVDIFVKLGHLSYPSDLLVAQEQVAELSPERVLVIAGGSQGEATSALRKISQQTHPYLRLDSGDRVVLSSRVIPGNEKRVFSMLNDLQRQGAELVTAASHPSVHVSGHASRDELESMLKWTRPRAFIPVHGTLLHMNQHRELAAASGVEHCCVVENGRRVGIYASGELKVLGGFPAGVERLVPGGGVLDARTRRHRYTLARRGVIGISFALSDSEELRGRIAITARGVVGVDEDEAAMRVIESCIQQTIRTMRGSRMRSPEAVIVQAVRSIVLQMCGEKPMILVHVLRWDHTPSAI